MPDFRFRNVRYKPYGYPLVTRTENKCFFSSEITDGLVMIDYSQSYEHLTTHM